MQMRPKRRKTMGNSEIPLTILTLSWVKHARLVTLSFWMKKECASFTTNLSIPGKIWCGSNRFISFWKANGIRPWLKSWKSTPFKFSLKAMDRRRFLKLICSAKTAAYDTSIRIATSATYQTKLVHVSVVCFVYVSVFFNACACCFFGAFPCCLFRACLCFLFLACLCCLFRACSCCLFRACFFVCFIHVSVFCLVHVHVSCFVIIWLFDYLLVRLNAQAGPSNCTKRQGLPGAKGGHRISYKDHHQLQTKSKTRQHSPHPRCHRPLTPQLYP